MNTEKVLYSKEQYEDDEKKVRSAEAGESPLDLRAFKRLMVSEICAKTNILNNNRIGHYSIEQIEKALANPQLYNKVLIDTSNYLMTISSFYMRINRYFGAMGLFNYRVDTYDLKNDKSKDIVQKYKADYHRLNAQLEKMNLKHEFSKIMAVLPSEDLFCGLIFEDDTDFFILKLPPSLCKVAQIQDGVFNFKINLSAINPLDISSYPVYLQKAYLRYRSKEDFADGWYIPSADKQICIKMNESCLYPLPLMIMLARDIFDIDLYKKLKLQKARVDNYKAIVIEIPIDKTSVDKPLLTEDTISIFAETNKANMPDDVGLLHTLGSAEAISFKDNTNNTNNLSDAIENFYDSSGVSSQLFNGATASSALKYSAENDAAIIYRVYRQLERYMNRFFKLRKFNRANYKFAFRIQNSTVFNKADVSDGYLKAAEHGLPFKLDYAISLGLSENRIIGNLFVENMVLELHEKLIPLPTSYTQSTDGTGRPTNESQGQDLGDSGEKTLDSEANDNR